MRVWIKKIRTFVLGYFFILPYKDGSCTSNACALKRCKMRQPHISLIIQCKTKIEEVEHIVIHHVVISTH